jgi:hypothetical protein
MLSVVFSLSGQAAFWDPWNCTVTERSSSQDFPAQTFVYKLYTCDLASGDDWFCPVVEQQLQSQTGCVKFWAYVAKGEPAKINVGYKETCEIGAPLDNWSFQSEYSPSFEFQNHNAGIYTKIACVK